MATAMVFKGCKSLLPSHCVIARSVAAKQSHYTPSPCADPPEADELRSRAGSARGQACTFGLSGKCIPPAISL